MNLEFPRLVYKDNGPHQRPGGTYSHLLVVDQNEYELALADAWHDSLEAAIAAPKVSRALMPSYAYEEKPVNQPIEINTVLEVEPDAPRGAADIQTRGRGRPRKEKPPAEPENLTNESA